MLYREKRIRFFIFLGAAVLHAVLLLVVVLPAARQMLNEESVEPPVIRLVDIEEERPPPPPPPPPERPPEIAADTIEAIAEFMIETDEVPDVVTVYEPVYVQEETIEYFSMGRIDREPQFPTDRILNAIVYPPIAQRSGIEGTVYLELFIDAQGTIRNISILRETPENRGFGEAAVNAFRDITVVPAESNGQKVAVRYRYPIRFSLR